MSFYLNGTYLRQENAMYFGEQRFKNPVVIERTNCINNKKLLASSINNFKIINCSLQIIVAMLCFFEMITWWWFFLFFFKSDLQFHFTSY